MENTKLNGTKLPAKRVKISGEKNATVLENAGLKVLIEDIGSMIPEMSLINDKQRINAHWLPWFRSNSGKPYQASEHDAFWKSGLLYNVAGNFPCIPNFGPDHIIDGINMPPHGWTANLPWLFISSGNDEESGAVWALSVMECPDEAMPLFFRKIDVLVPDHNIHYVSISIANKGTKDHEICMGWHNTVGAPFLAAGCRISAAASVWATAPCGSEFDNTTRLVPGMEFLSLSEAPLGSGNVTTGVTDLSRVPGPLGYTDFVTGRIDSSLDLGWSSVINPELKAAYICFFTGSASAQEDDIILRFNNLWMQYGGRPFTPWAPYEGGTDLCYCLGTENSLAAYAMGLDYSRKMKSLLGAPTTVTIPCGKQKCIRYGTLFAQYQGQVLDEGILSLETEAKMLVSKGRTGHWRFNADPSFRILKNIESKVNSM